MSRFTSHAMSLLYINDFFRYLGGTSTSLRLLNLQLNSPTKWPQNGPPNCQKEHLDETGLGKAWLSKLLY